MAGKKVLVVDDDKDLAKLLIRKISQEGFEVLVAYDGLQAVHLAHREIPSLIILDIKLPAGGGIGAVANLKNSLKTEFIPIIAISASDSPDIPRELQSYGVEEFMLKPLDIEALLRKIKKITGTTDGPVAT
jgi:DNA-binding response OmpR family regulator